MSDARITLGKQGEDIAVTYLKKKKLIIITRNYRQKTGEIDIIAKDGEWLVFIEVKTRMSLRFGQPFEAVTQRKQNQIGRVALDYMTRHKLSNQLVRFDVISIIVNKNKKPKIEHLPNCFEPTIGFH